MLDLIGTEPLGRTNVGGASVGMLLDPKAEGQERIEVESHLLEIRTELAQWHVIAIGRAQAVQEGDVQTHCCRRGRGHGRAPIRLKIQCLGRLSPRSSAWCSTRDPDRSRARDPRPAPSESSAPTLMRSTPV